MGILAKFPIDPLMGLPKTGTSFAAMPWEEVSKVCKAGKANEYFMVGDQRTISVDGTDYVIDIIGIEHDDVTDSTNYGRSKAGITCQLHECYTTKYNMNSSDSNAGGWTSSRMRTTTIPTILSKFPTELQNVIVYVNKKTSAGSISTTINTDSDKLFLPSCVELGGDTASSYSTTFISEGNQYEYYNTDAINKLTKYLVTSASEATYWWLRSPMMSRNDSFCCVDSIGSIYYTGNGIGKASYQTFGVAPCFCI